MCIHSFLSFTGIRLAMHSATTLRILRPKIQAVNDVEARKNVEFYKIAFSWRIFVDIENVEKIARKNIYKNCKKTERIWPK